MYFGHVAIWTHNLDALTEFYCKYFGGKVFYDEPYGTMQSRYIGFDEHCYLELMQRSDIGLTAYAPGEERDGLTHIALNCESTARVREITAQIEKDGYKVVVQPTDYGTDIFYESCVLDPDGNRVEICVHADDLKKEYEAAGGRHNP